MHEVFVAALSGGALAIALFSILGWVGGAGAYAHAHVAHGGHAHIGHGGHASAESSGTVHGGHAHLDGGQSHATASGRGGHAQAGQGHGSHAAGQSAVKQSPLASSLSWTLSWISPLTLAGAAVWFGAAGLIAERSSSSVAVIVAVVAAVIGAALVRSIVSAFVRAGTPPLQLTGEGAIATVNAAIRVDGPGEVVYTLEGLHRSVPARSVDGRFIPRGTSVVIVRREAGFAWVTPLDPLSELQPDPVAPLPGGSAAERSAPGPAGERMHPEELER